MLSNQQSNSFHLCHPMYRRIKPCKVYIHVGCLTILKCSVTSVLYGTVEIHLHTYLNTMSEQVTLHRCTVTFPRRKCLQVDVVEYAH